MHYQHFLLLCLLNYILVRVQHYFLSMNYIRIYYVIVYRCPNSSSVCTFTTFYLFLTSVLTFSIIYAWIYWICIIYTHHIFSLLLPFLLYNLTSNICAGCLYFEVGVKLIYTQVTCAGLLTLWINSYSGKKILNFYSSVPNNLFLGFQKRNFETIFEK